MISEQDILKKLSQIIDPDLNKDIVSLGFVRNILIKKDEVSFDIALTTPACPVRDEFKKKAEQLIQQLPGIVQVKVNMTTLPRTQSERQGLSESSLKNVRSTIAVSSCKGGVGKSTVAARIAHELDRRGFKVGLMDADIYGPSIPTLFDLKNVSVKVNSANQFLPIEKNKLKIMSFGFLLGDAPAVMRGPIVTRYIQQMLLNTAWGELDYLFIDMPPGTGDVQLTITQTIQLSGALIVTTPHTLSLIDVSRGILMFERVAVPILGIIENMSYFICDQCDKKHYPFGSHGAKTLKEKFGVDVLSELPILAQFTFKIDQSMVNDYVVPLVDRVVMALGKQSVLTKQTPEIKADQERIMLSWADGSSIAVNNRELRMNCRCALCVNELTGEMLLKEKDIRPDIMPKEIVPLGNYALGITWSDGHSSGIYPYELIKNLASSHRPQSTG